MRLPLPAPAVAIALLAAAAVVLSPLQSAAAFVFVPSVAAAAGPFCSSSTSTSSGFSTPAAMEQSPQQQQQPPSSQSTTALAAASSATAGGSGGGGDRGRKVKPTAFPPSPPNRRIREVCTAVVRDPATGRFLALKRSKEVRSFQGHWHFISGGMELGDRGDPVRRAYRELEEEVQLLPQHVTLVARGRPLLVAPPRHRPGNKVILVHPILFDLVQPYRGPVLDRGVLNWENDDARWAALEDLEGLPTVPRLIETAERVLAVAGRRTKYGDGDAQDEMGAARGDDAWPPAVRAALQAIRKDRTHGAMQLMGWAVDAVGTWARARLEEGGEAPSVRALEEELKDLGYALCRLRPSMAALANGLLQALDAALSPPTTTTTTTTPTGFLQRAADAAAAFAGTEVARRNERLTEAAVRALLARAREGDGAFTVLTLSLSSTLMAVFRGLKERWSQQKQQEGRRLRVIVCESRPLYEGARAAAALAEMGYEVTLITEAQMGLFAPQAHTALLGADAVLGNLNDASPPPSSPSSASVSASAAAAAAAPTPPMVINKAGSYPLALCCHHAGVSVLVVSSDLKITDQALSAFELEEMAAQEVVDGPVGSLLGEAQGRVEVKNVYFEPIPLLLLPTPSTTANSEALPPLPPAPPLVSVLVTEEGAVDGGQAASMVVARAQERRRRFEGLFFG